MSTIAANSGSRAKGLIGATRLESRRIIVACATAIALAGIAGSVLVATSDHLVDPVAWGLEIAVIAVGTAAIAVFWAAARPGNRIATVLLAYAAAVAGNSLQGATDPLLHSVGVLFEVPAFLLGYYLVFIFPGGRLSGALEKVLLVGIAGAVLASEVPWFFFSPVVAGGAPLAGCKPNCPTNALMIADKPSIAEGLGTVMNLFSVLVAVAIVCWLSYRIAEATRPRRRALLPVYVPTLLLTIPFGVFWAAAEGLVSLDASARDTVGWFVTAGRVTLTFGFLFAILQAMLFAGVALKTIVGRLGERQDAAHLRDLVAEALDDPQVELAFEADRAGNLFLDSRGGPVDPTHPVSGAAATAIRRRGEIVAYILHDAALETDPELVQAAGQAVLLALEGDRLGEELESKAEELRASRARIIATAERERVRLERDLHDGAQQRLMSIQVKLALAKQQPPDELAATLDEIGVDAAAAVEELRTLAHGIYPTLLLERGLPDALRSLATTAAIPIHVTDEGIGRCPGTVEAAVYFCSVEAIHNAAKHAGGGARVSVTLGRQNGGVHFAVADDGVGIAAHPSADGVGLNSMRDRVGAVGGELDIASAPGQGTKVSGWIPDHPSESE